MPANGSQPAVEIASAWARMLLGLREPALQVGWVREQLERLGAVRAADVLTVVLARAEQREERYAVLLLRISLALATPALVPLRRAIANLAAVRAQHELARFLGAAPDTQAANVEVEHAAEETPASGATSRGRPLSLGERKSLARTRDRNLLARVLRDPHPDVVRILLDNPALTEPDVVRLCARRPVPSAVLTQVFRHARWVVRYRVRLTLALNPHTDEVLALQLLPHLTAQDRREVARSGDLSARVRAACLQAEQGLLH